MRHNVPMVQLQGGCVHAHKTTWPCHARLLRPAHSTPFRAQVLTCNVTVASAQRNAGDVATGAEAAQELCTPCGGLGQPCCREEAFGSDVGARNACGEGMRCLRHGPGEAPLCALCGTIGTPCCDADTGPCPTEEDAQQPLACSATVDADAVPAVSSAPVCEACGSQDQPCCPGAPRITPVCTCPRLSGAAPSNERLQASPEMSSAPSASQMARNCSCAAYRRRQAATRLR